MIASPSIPDDWIEPMVKAGIPVTFENYLELINDGRKPDDLSKEDAVYIFEEKKTPQGWGSTSVYME